MVRLSTLGFPSGAGAFKLGSWRALMVLAACGWLSSLPAWPQDSTGFLSGSRGSTYSYRAWTIRSGLPQESVTGLAQTRDGYLWMGTFGGLVRFNGVELEAFDLADHPDLAGNRMHALHADRRGTLWIGHPYGGASHWDGRRFTSYGERAGLPGGDVRAILEDADGNVWIGTDDGLARLQDGNFEILNENDGLPAPQVRSLALDRGGGLWVGTAAGLAKQTGAGRFSTIDEVPRVGISSILEDPEGTLWLDSARGLLRQNEGRWQTVLAGSPGYLGNKLAVDRHGDLWYGAHSASRLYRFTAEDRRAPLPAAAEYFELPHPAITLFVDREGTLWTGNQSTGLWSLERAPVTRWTTEHGLRHHEIRTVMDDGEGGLWIASACEMPLSRWREGTFTTFDPGADGHQLSCVGSFLRDRQGDLWIGAGGHLVRFREGTEIARHLLADTPDPVINALFEDRAGRIWIGLGHFGLSRLDLGEDDDLDGAGDDAEVRFYTEHDGLVNNSVVFLTEDIEGNLWIGTGDGLSRFDGSTFENFTRNDGLPAGAVRSLHPDEDGTLWIGTYGGGLGRLKDGVLTRITRADGLYDNVITRILEDERGHFWMLGNRGLFAVDRDQLNAFADGERDSVFSISFGHVEGMTEGSGGRQPAGWQTDDGKMWFPTVDGLAMIDARGFRPNPMPPLVMIERLRAGRRELAPAPEVALEVGERDLEIHYAASSYAAPEKVRFRYRLQGYDDEWSKADSRRMATYTNLPPGTYVFRVTASNHHGVWSEEDASIRVRIPPPPWRTWWAYTFYALAFFGLASESLRRQQTKVERQRVIAERERHAGDRLREANRLKDGFLAERERLIAELEAKNSELARFNYTVAHDLRNPLVTILNYLGLARSDAANRRYERLELDLERLEEAAGKLHRQLEALFELSRVGVLANPPEEVDLGQLVEVAVAGLGESIAEAGVMIEVAADLPRVRGDRPRLLEMTRHLLDNAIKYRGEVPVLRIEVGWRSMGGESIFFVRDNGSGIEPRYQEKVFGLFERLAPQAADGTGIGLTLVKRIVEVHGGQVWIESEGRGRGATFCFTLPGEASSGPVETTS